MEVEEIQAQACKFPRVGNVRNDANKIVSNGDDEEDGEVRRANGEAEGGANGFRGWHPHSSRIFRVSRSCGGKDRHSKVWTSKGLRDRRVRLSVSTAIQFYDLQDRLGVDQPSKAVEWLIKAASDAIAELPSLSTPFPETPKQLSDEKRGSIGGNERGFDSTEVELDKELNYNNKHNQSQHLSLSKSACSSTSETSKGSGLSLSRPEIHANRAKARERARERARKEKKDNETSRIDQHGQNLNPISHNASFTELLTGAASTSPMGGSSAVARQWSSTPMDYFSSELLGPTPPSSSSRTHHSSSSSSSSGQIHLGNSLPQIMSFPVAFNVGADHNHSELQHFPFVPEHFLPVVSSQPPGAGGDYNLNFTMSSGGLAGFNRGTLQSNSPSLLPHLQRFPTIDGSSNVPFFIGAASAPPAPPMENHHHNHQFSPQFDGRLQLCYGDGSRHSDIKGKGKN